MQELPKTYGNIAKTLYEKFAELNKQSMGKLLKDIYEEYPTFMINSTIKEEVMEYMDEFLLESNMESKPFNQSIEQKIESVQSHDPAGKKYTPSEYLYHVDQILKD